MPTPSTRLRANLQDPGSNLNVWGTKLNTEALALLDEAIAGVERITLSGSTYTLSSANYATDQARNAGLIFQGSPTATVAVTIPAVEKVYTCVNQTAQTVTLGCGGTDAVLAAGDTATVWCDGTDCGLGSVSVGTVNGLITNAALSGTLPGQAGNSGKFLQTNGSTPLWADVPAPDVGGGADATVTTSTALTASSSVVQSASMAANAQSITLPDATTLTKGGRKFVILNTGNRTFGVRSNGGTLLTVVPAGASAELHLYDNGTAAGGWGVTGRGLEPALTLVDHTAPTTVAGPMEAHTLRLTDNLSLHLCYASPGLYVAAADSTPGTGSVGTWTLIDSGSVANGAYNHMFRISDTQAIVFWVQGANSKAAVLTVSGTTVSVGSAASVADTSILGAVTFTGRPILAQLTPTLYVTLRNASAYAAYAISVSGTAVTFGSAATFGSSVQQVLATYRIDDTKALALYIDDSGSAGSPYSIRGVVLSVSGTTVTVGASNGYNDTAGTVAAFGSCQLSANKYVVGWHSSQIVRAAAFTVSGTTVTVGTVLDLETVPVTADATHGFSGGNRWQQTVYAIDGSRALFTYGATSSSTPSRHVVLTESGGSVTAGTRLFSLWTDANGGNFPQTPAGFLAISGDTGTGSSASDMRITGVSVSGTTLAVTGAVVRADIYTAVDRTARFGLSGGVSGAFHEPGRSDAGDRYGLMHLFRYGGAGSPRYLGPLMLPDFGSTAYTPVEVASSKAALLGLSMTRTSAGAALIRLLIVEFAQ